MASATTVRNPPRSNSYRAAAVVPPGDVTYHIDYQWKHRHLEWLNSEYTITIAHTLLRKDGRLSKDCLA